MWYITFHLIHQAIDQRARTVVTMNAPTTSTTQAPAKIIIGTPKNRIDPARATGTIKKPREPKDPHTRDTGESLELHEDGAFL